jgi:hypothetical protein
MKRVILNSEVTYSDLRFDRLSKMPGGSHVAELLEISLPYEHPVLYVIYNSARRKRQTVL